MACELLIRATDHGIWKKGYIVSIRESELMSVWPWGGKETLPDFVQVEITDADKPQVENYLYDLRNTFDYEILNENEQGYRIKISVAPYIAQELNEFSLKQEIRDYIEDTYNAQLFDHDSANTEWATFDIPKPFDLQAAKLDLQDKFEQTVDVKRYYFSSSGVDTVISNGGRMSVTRTQAENNIVDKLS